MNCKEPAKKRAKSSSNEWEVAPAVELSESDVERKRKIPKIKMLQTTFLDLLDSIHFDILEYLSLNDLCTMAEVCISYKEIAQQFFVKKYRTLNLSSLIDPVSKKFTLIQIRRLFYNFGGLISSLTINVDQLNDRFGLTKLLILLDNYCIASLNELTIQNPLSNNPSTGFNELCGQMAAVTAVGMNLMLRDMERALYETRNTTIYCRGKSTQIQEFVRIDLPEGN